MSNAKRTAATELMSVLMPTTAVLVMSIITINFGITPTTIAGVALHKDRLTSRRALEGRHLLRKKLDLVRTGRGNEMRARIPRPLTENSILLLLRALCTRGKTRRSVNRSRTSNKADHRP